MSKAPQQLIRLYQRDEDGMLYDAREDFTIEDFCGNVPRVGDLIVSRWLRDSRPEARAEEQAWKNRTVLVVEAVYFRPDKRNDESDDSWVVIVVTERRMTEAEWALL